MSCISCCSLVAHRGLTVVVLVARPMGILPSSSSSMKMVDPWFLLCSLKMVDSSVSLPFIHSLNNNFSSCLFGKT